MFLVEINVFFCLKVTKGRNLLEKGKNGNDAYCIIGLGKEKYLTSVKQKTTNPVWDEQAELLDKKINFLIIFKI